MASIKQLPFTNITNAQLHSLITRPQDRIKPYLKQNNFTNYLNQSTPQVHCQNNKCNYYTEEELKDQITNSRSVNNIKLLHLNIRSLNKNIHKLTTLLQSTKLDPDIIALTETGKTNVKNSAAFLNKKFTFINDPPTTKNGGTGLLINKTKSFKEREDLKLKSKSHNINMENTWIELQSPNIIIGVIYRHPTPTNKIKNFTHALEESIYKINKENKMAIICGDINIDGLKTSDNHTQNFFNMTNTHNFIPTITLPTRFSQNNASVIDHILVKHTPNTIQNKTLTGNIFSDISDHLPNFIMIQNKQQLSTHKKVRIFGQKKH